MSKIKNRIGKWNSSLLLAIGVGCVLLLGLLLLWHGNANSNQAVNALMAQVRFEGEYRITDGPWQKIVEGEHIPATEGDVTLRGNFHMWTPDGEYVGIYSGEVPVALYADHIHLTISVGEGEPYSMDMEDPLYGPSACGEDWTAYVFEEETTEPLQILIHNPHRFGNETAIDEMLANTALWANIGFEKEILQSGAVQRNTGIFFIIVSLALLGVALFSTLIHIKNSRLLWILGFTVLFAGVYLAYSADAISFWQDSIVSNTTILGGSMIFYMLFLSAAIVYFLVASRKIGIAAVCCLGVVDAVVFVLPVLTDMLFYDTWVCWITAQLVANSVLVGCLIIEYFNEKKRNNGLYICAILPLLSFAVDVVMTELGIWKGGVVSEKVFVGLFVVTMVIVLRIIPHGINAAVKARALEAEKAALNAQLAESRISTMISQIRPHFIYNTLGSIEQLCDVDPEKAGKLVHNFAKYLRGNFGELDNPRPILMSQEMEHVKYYVSIENVRFPDMTFSFHMNSGEFHIPALTIQPIVENAIKHGLMKLPEGGTVCVTSYETADSYCVCVEDNGMGFDTNELLDERKHVGIRNIRERLKAMVNGSLEIESTVGAGTKVLITIPKEVGK